MTPDQRTELMRLKLAANDLNQRSVAVLALAEMVQNYRILTAQLLAYAERTPADEVRETLPGSPPPPTG